MKKSKDNHDSVYITKVNGGTVKIEFQGTKMLAPVYDIGPIVQVLTKKANAVAGFNTADQLKFMGADSVSDLVKITSAVEDYSLYVPEEELATFISARTVQEDQYNRFLNDGVDLSDLSKVTPVTGGVVVSDLPDPTKALPEDTQEMYDHRAFMRINRRISNLTQMNLLKFTRVEGYWDSFRQEVLTAVEERLNHPRTAGLDSSVERYAELTLNFTAALNDLLAVNQAEQDPDEFEAYWNKISKREEDFYTYLWENFIETEVEPIKNTEYVPGNLGRPYENYEPVDSDSDQYIKKVELNSGLNTKEFIKDYVEHRYPTFKELCKTYGIGYTRGNHIREAYGLGVRTDGTLEV